MNWARLCLLSITTGLLLGYSWPFVGYIPLIFIAWIPLLLADYLIDVYYEKSRTALAFAISYPGFLLWNLLDTWWMKNSIPEGNEGWIAMLLANGANAALMALSFAIYHYFRHFFQKRTAIFLLPVFWICFEWLHHDWDLSWPWLTLGNAFSEHPHWVQWYEITSIFGGSLWVLLVNIMLFQWMLAMAQRETAKARQWILMAIAMLVLPIGISLWRYQTFAMEGDPIEVVVVQPNIDPHQTKFDEQQLLYQLQTFNALALDKISTHTKWLIGPETALPFSFNEDEAIDDPQVRSLIPLVKQWPALQILTGVSSFRFYRPDEKVPVSARRLRDQPNIRYDYFNAAMHLDSMLSPRFYHKSKLVPGVEQMPFPAIFSYFEQFALDLGGTSGTLGKQKERTVFGNKEHALAPSICYESIYSDFMRLYVRNGARWIAIITNDGWWGDTPGYKQHASYARLRAIELRRWIARSANTGISCFINARGDVLQATPYWQAACIKQEILMSQYNSPYAQMGPVIGWSALLLTIITMVWGILLRFKYRK